MSAVGFAAFIAAFHVSRFFWRKTTAESALRLNAKETPMVEREIFDAALAIADPAERAAYLEQASAGDAALRAHLEQLLKMHGQLGSFLQGEAPAVAATVAATMADT